MRDAPAALRGSQRMKLTRQGVRDLDATHAPVVGLVVPATGPATLPAPAPRVENPEHDSLVVKFDQLEGLLADIVCADDRTPDEARDALKLVRELRKQVLK